MRRPSHSDADRIVVWVGWKDDGGGVVVVLRHPNGMTSTYNHNREALGREGDRVAGGGRIASAWASGWATGVPRS